MKKPKPLKIKIVDFEPKHGEVLVKAIRSLGQYNPSVEEFAPMADRTLAYCKTAILGEQVIACAGVRKLFHGVGECWSFLAPEMLDRPLLLVKTMREAIESAKLLFNLHRIQMFVVMGHREGYRLARALGFMLEGPRWAWGPDKKTHMCFIKFYG